MSDNPYESPDSKGESQQRKRTGWRTTVFVVVSIGAILALFVLVCVLPNPRLARGAARRIECLMNLKQIALALRNYESKHGTLPPAYTVDAQGKPLHSWRTLILPHLDQQTLYDQIDLTKPWDHPVNAKAFESEVRVFHCPGADPAKGQTTYLAMVAPDGCLRGSVPIATEDVSDGHGQTLMVVEVDA